MPVSYWRKLNSMKPLWFSGLLWICAIHCHLAWAQPQIPLDSLLKKGMEFRQGSKYDSALFYFNKALDQAVTESNWKGHVQTLNGLGLVYIDLSKYTQSESFLLKSIDLGKQHLSANDSDLGEAYGRLAYCYSQAGRIEEATNNYLISLEIFKAGVGEISQQTANTYSNLGAAYYLFGQQSDLAIKNLEKSIEINKQLDGEKSLEMARAYNDLANVYSDLEDHEKAINYHRSSLKIKQDILEPLHPALGVSNFNLARSFFALGDYQRAIDHYHNTLTIDIATFGAEHRWVGEDYYSIADCYTVQGNHNLALKYAQRASDIMQITYGADNHRAATTYNTIGQVYLNLENYDEAELYFEKALNAFEMNQMDTRDITHGKALAHSQLGILATIQDDYNDGIRHHQQALALHRSILQESHQLIAKDFQNLAVGYTKAGEREKALDYYQTALKMMTTTYGQAHPEVARLHMDIGNFYLQNQQNDEALEYYQTALVSVVPSLPMEGLPNPSLSQLSLLPITLDVLNQKGWAFDRKFEAEGNPNDLRQAMEAYQLAMELIDTLRIGFLEQGSKQSLLENHFQVYDRSLSAVLKLSQLDQSSDHLATALRIMEKSKAFLLLTSLRESAAKSFAGIPHEVLQKEQDLKFNLAFYETKAQNEHDEAKKLVWREKAFAMNEKYDSMMLSLSHHYPQYHSLKYNSEVLDLPSLQKNMRPDQLIIQYFLGESDLYVLAITSTDQMLYSTPADQRFINNVEILRKSLSEKSAFDPQFALASNQLYQALLAPAENLMANRTLSIIPDGALNYFPYEVLCPKLTGLEKSYTDLKYLILQNNINYAYSATLWNSLNEKQIDGASLNYLAFAPKFNEREEESADLTGQLAFNEVVRGNLSELRGTSREASSIASFFKGQFFEGGLATESQFKMNASNFEILHLATHAIVDDQNPMNSRLLFTAVGDSLEDGDLHAWELYNMQLNARMAVLSACNTGFGKLQRGEGVMSLGRAFAYAGCPSVVMSLWPAQDEATADIMSYFYEGLSRGYSKDRALREAKLHFLKETDDLFAHPFYWAGFVVQGDPSPLSGERGLVWWQWILIIVPIVLIAVFISRKFSFISD